MKRIFSLALLGALVVTPSYASTPSNASLEKLSELAPYMNVLADVIAPLAMERQQLAYIAQNNPKLTEAQRTEILKLYDDYAKNLIERIDTPQRRAELKKAYIAAAKKHYTQAEVDAIIGFFGSEVGKSAVQKENTIFSDYIKQVEPSITKAITDYQKTNQNKTEDKIKQLLGE